jgi:hypothetical protein
MQNGKRFTPYRFAPLVLAIACICGELRADDGPRRIGALPRIEADVVAAFENAKRFACRPVVEGRSVESRGLSPIAAADVGLRAEIRVAGRTFPIPMSRRPVLSIGMRMTEADAAELPLLSASTIQDYLAKHFVCLQVLLRRDLDDGTLRLHDVAAAACLPCGGAQLTESFEPIVRQSLDDTRVLGLTESTSGDASDPGTLVIAVRNPTADGPSTSVKTVMKYEWLFVRAERIATPQSEEDLALHVFLTADGRTKLHYLPAYSDPGTNTNCMLVGSVVFTAYARDGLTPARSALRSLAIQGPATSEAELNRLATQADAAVGHWSERPTLVFDALIAERKGAK